MPVKYQMKIPKRNSESVTLKLEGIFMNIMSFLKISHLEILKFQNLKVNKFGRSY